MAGLAKRVNIISLQLANTENYVGDLVGSFTDFLISGFIM